LLHAALREVLGDHVKQAGSLVTPERFRFDFSHFTQVSAEKLLEIERIVNRHIRQNLEINTSVMSKEEAMMSGAMAIFEEKYGETVRVVQMGEGVSMELCGGTHAERTGDIGLFRICGESAVAANMRRIEAITGEVALIHDQEKESTLKNAAMLLKSSPEKMEERIEKLLKDLRDKDREIATLKAKVLAGKSEDFLENVREVEGIRVISRKLKVASPAELREWGDRIKDRLKSGIILLGAEAEGRAILTCLVTEDLQEQFHAGNIIKRLSAVVGGKGGGKSHMAQGGGNQPENLEKALEGLDGIIRGE
ncbi:MAG TPA: alanine--tRNA ligase, partial [Deltaproteobacteria bacterium]|nr:alanine--tRNA ligase [Deltaproteobacteria bacterium]